MRDSNIAIAFENLTKCYGDFKAVDGLSFQVKRGDFLAFLGPNGAGKTTTIHVLCGLCTIQSGSAKVFGYDIQTDYLQTRKLIGLCSQDFNFDPFLNIKQLLIYQAGYFGISSYEAKRRAHELLKRFQLLDKCHLKYRALSGGMKRRLLLCRALIHDPEIIILDEPTAGCDLELKFRIWNYLSQLNAEGKTIFLTTHHMEEAEKLCETIGIINNGKLVKIDKKQNILRDKSLEDFFLEVTA